MNYLKWIICLCIASTLGSCAVVKPYQMEYLNQESMSLNATDIEKTEQNFESYREGASGANGGKTGGGCGCN